MARARFEDGTTGRPLGDDEDLDARAYADVPEPDVEDHWADMSPTQRAALTLRSLR